MSAENPVMVPIDPVPDPDPPIEEDTGSVSDNNIPGRSLSDNISDPGSEDETEDRSEDVTEQRSQKNDTEDTVSYEPSVITVETHSLDSISVNAVVDPEDLISVNSVSLNVISADDLSMNSISVNVSNNYISSSTIQIISQNNMSIWEKPFSQYTTSEGLLFTIMVTLVLGFVSNHLLKGLRHYGNI